MPEFFVIHGDRIVTEKICLDMKRNKVIFSFETGSVDGMALTDEFLLISMNVYAKIIIYKWTNNTYEPYTKGSIFHHGGG